MGNVPNVLIDQKNNSDGRSWADPNDTDGKSKHRDEDDERIGADGLTNDQWVQTSKPTKNDELADIFINQNFENEHDKGKKKKKGTSSSAKTGRRAPRGNVPNVLIH